MYEYLTTDEDLERRMIRGRVLSVLEFNKIRDKVTSKARTAYGKKICSEMTAGKPADWGSAWEEVTRAIRKYGYSEQEKALDSMSPLTQNAVEKLGWRAICLSENPDTIRAQFRQVYEICSKREAEDRQISPQLKAMISNLLDERNSALLEDGSRSMIGEGAP